MPVTLVTFYSIDIPGIIYSKAVANGLVGQVLAGALFLKTKTKFHFAKQVINKSTRVIFQLVQLVILLCSR